MFHKWGTQPSELNLVFSYVVSSSCDVKNTSVMILEGKNLLAFQIFICQPYHEDNSSVLLSKDHCI